MIYLSNMSSDYLSLALQECRTVSTKEFEEKEKVIRPSTTNLFRKYNVPHLSKDDYFFI